MHKANFSSSAGKYYLGIALKAELVESIKDRSIVITANGRKLLAQYESVVRLLESDVISTDK
jgi:predicted transcriptional regulator